MDNFRGYLLRRFLYSLLTLWVVATMIFLLFRVMPGDPALRIVDPTFPPETRDQLLASFGLDRPIGEQYILYLQNLSQGNFGVSFFSRRPVTQEIGDRVANTVILATVSFLFAYPLGIAGGAFLASKRGTWIENVGITVALF